MKATLTVSVNQETLRFIHDAIERSVSDNQTITVYIKAEEKPEHDFLSPSDRPRKAMRV